MKHAVYTGTRNLYGDMETAAKSLVANSDVDRVWFLIEDESFPRELPEMVACRDVRGVGSVAVQLGNYRLAEYGESLVICEECADAVMGRAMTALQRFCTATDRRAV